MLNDLRKIRDSIVLLEIKVQGEGGICDFCEPGTMLNTLAYFLQDAHYDLEICIGKIEHEKRNASDNGSDGGSPSGDGA